MPLDSSTRAFAWPAIFTHPRVLRAEDQTYLEFLRENKVVFDDSDDESSSDEFDSDPDPGEVEDNVVEGSSSSSPASSGGNVVEEPDTRHPVRLFMQPTIDGNGMGKQRLDQEQVVSEFCEYAAKQPRDPSQEDDFIAVIDIRSNAKPGSGEVSSLTGIAKPQRGGLTACQLSEELGIKEFSVPQGGSATNEENSSKSPTVGAHRELISLPDMGEPGMRVLAECASERERGALARFFYDHLQFSPSVDAAVTTQGFPKFAFHLNVPFIVFRRHKKLREDVRMKPGAPTARPLRRSWSAACLRAPSLTDEDSPMACFYEAQASIMLFGLDNRVYKVYGTIDTYYQPKSKHSVEAYHRDYKESNGERMWDPFSRRSREVNRPIWDSRHYFLSVWAGYLEQASREWDEVTTVMKEAMNQRRKTPHVTGNYVKDLDTWTEEMLDLLNVLIEPLSETTAVWKEFENCDLGYFVSNDDEEKTILLQQIKKVYSGLRLKLTSLNSLRDELKSTHRHKVQAHFNFQVHSVAVKVFGLTIIGFCFSSLTQVTGMFNMQDGVLPFKATPHTFTACLIAFILINLFALYISLTWEQWSIVVFAKLKEVLEMVLEMIPVHKTGKPTVTPPSVAPEELIESTADVELEEVQRPQGVAFVARIRPRTPIDDVESGMSQ